ncbi:hypothetical protein HU200_021831 [Digitaria exilis]|uniref:GDSL esterase/lipase n=1 Tax=Digitaria exilis TaxID=1010633 RepID=A0A835EYX9_9POAL|nr:hypothetical protein HU200_021831 [Digitaria exilis]
MLCFPLLVFAAAGADNVVDDGVCPSQTQFARIFSFGDSLTDTGNALRILGARAWISRPPYGETFFGHPSGRASDGRIMIHFIGARTVLVPGMIPMGCEPQLLAQYNGSIDAGGYDPETGCITWLNDLAVLHNRELRRTLKVLRQAHPGTYIVYADLYRAITDLIVSPGRYGFISERPPVACCGDGMAASCGAAGMTVCGDPSEYVSWDGVHFTEAANRRIACAVLERARVVTDARRRRIGCD